MPDPFPPPLTLLHGFAQNRNCWGRFLDPLAARRDVSRLDLPGHGAGGPPADGWETAGRLVPVIEASDAQPRDWLGYSLGGRMLLHLLLAHPSVVRRAVLIGATAGLENPAERAERQHADKTLADRIERDGIEAFLEGWLAMPMWGGLPEEAQFVDERRTNTAAGLAGSLRLAGTGAQDDLWPRLNQIDAPVPVPVLVLAGESDQKFTAIGRRLAAALPHGEFRSIPGVGHAAHLEAPGRAAEAVNAWLDA